MRWLDAFLERVAELHPRRFFLDAWDEINRDAFGPDGRPPSKVDLRPLSVVLVVATVLILQEYLGAKADFRRLISFILDDASATSSPTWHWLLAWLGPWARDVRYGEYFRLWQLAYWAGTRIIGYVVVPLLVLPLLPGVRLRDLGLGFKGFTDHLWLYFVLFCPVLVAVVIVSFRGDFSSYYPFYQDPVGVWDLLVWEALYFAQFAALEFFFRGFMLHPLKRSMGAYAIFVMVVPYCMIHFGKPFLECFAAIIAGVVLGTLSLRTRSIWCGALIHMSVAATMDVAALVQTGRFWTLLVEYLER
jgi:membrane protease YdiL (CAAX protease family)